MKRTIDYKSIGERIRFQRRKMDITQEKLSEMADVSTSFIGHIERGEKKPSVETVAKICECLEMDIEYCLFGSFKSDKRKNQLCEDIMKAVERYIESR
jgi:transcriptional regulator with XRE-family HTH domain